MSPPIPDHTTLGLPLPELVEDAPAAPYTTPRGAERWVARLPLAHVGETARLVYTGLRDLNRRPIKNTDRLRILEAFARPVNFVTESLERHYLEQPLPLSEKRLKVAKLARALQQEMAVGHKIVIEMGLAGRLGRIDGRALRRAIYGALHYLGETLLQSYLIYVAPPAGVWAETHHLYYLAEHNQLHREVVQSHLSDYRPANSIVELYKEILLLATANPYRLAQREIQTLHGHLSDWSRQAALHPLVDPRHPPGLFAVHLDEDAPPAYYVPTSDRSRLPCLRILDVAKVAELTRHYLETASCAVGKSLPPSTFRRLVLAWGAPPKRGFARTQRRALVQMVVGIGAVHHVIERDQGRHPGGPEPEPAHFEAGDTAPPPPDAPIDVWDVAENPTLQTILEDDLGLGEPQSGLHLEAAGAEEPDPYPTTACHLLNESPTGCCLRCGGEDAPLIVVGMVIAVQLRSDPEGENDERWRVGVIRWIRQEGKNELTLGAELIGPRAEPVHLRRIVGGQPRGEPQPALLVPEVRHLEQPPTVIAPALFDAGDELCLYQSGGQRRIRLLKALECTNSFGQYQYLPLEDRAVTEEEASAESEFEEIWHYL